MLKPFNKYFSQQMRCNINAIERHSTKLRRYYLQIAAQLSLFSLAIVTKMSISNRRARTQKVITATSILEMNKFSVMTLVVVSFAILHSNHETILSGSLRPNKICTPTHLRVLVWPKNDLHIKEVISERHECVHTLVSSLFFVIPYQISRAMIRFDGGVHRPRSELEGSRCRVEAGFATHVMYSISVYIHKHCLEMQLILNKWLRSLIWGRVFVS